MPFAAYNIRLRPGLRERLGAAAARDGFDTTSDWVRALLQYGVEYGIPRAPEQNSEEVQKLQNAMQLQATLLILEIAKLGVDDDVFMNARSTVADTLRRRGLLVDKPNSSSAD
ncbi:hypothetical protein [Nitrospirillum amazonense]|uniref:hypothetical protein n=1 Tax=Nitrospirillum amazonense TaxID=28077 RepID=UPI00241239B8|nr:hypothetical protein [Nitrospirillum amazonense]MDG3443723.1 hypothetical protein [Nitrospirillum amazonense]